MFSLVFAGTLMLLAPSQSPVAAPPCHIAKVAWWEQRCRRVRRCRVVTIGCNEQVQCRDVRRCNWDRVCKQKPVCRRVKRCLLQKKCTNHPHCTTKRRCQRKRICKKKRRCKSKRVCKWKTILKAHKICERKGMLRICRKKYRKIRRRICKRKRICRSTPSCRYKRVCRPYKHCQSKRKCTNARVCKWRKECRSKRSCKRGFVCVVERICKTKKFCPKRCYFTRSKCRPVLIRGTVKRCPTYFPSAIILRPRFATLLANISSTTKVISHTSQAPFVGTVSLLGQTLHTQWMGIKKLHQMWTMMRYQWILFRSVPKWKQNKSAAKTRPINKTLNVRY